MRDLATHVANLDPEAAALQHLNSRSGRNFSIAVRQGQFRGFEGLGRDVRPVTDWYNSRSGALEALQGLLASY